MAMNLALVSHVTILFAMFESEILVLLKCP
jgi:hypothetical protein